MRVLRTMVIVVALFSVAPWGGAVCHAQTNDDDELMLLLMPVMSAAAQTGMLSSIGETSAQLIEPQVVAADRNAVLNFVNAYPVGTAPASWELSTTDGSWNSVGLGYTEGVDTSNYGAAIQAVIGGDQIGVIGKVNAGGLKAESLSG